MEPPEGANTETGTAHEGSKRDPPKGVPREFFSHPVDDFPSTLLDPVEGVNTETGTAPNNRENGLSPNCRRELFRSPAHGYRGNRDAKFRTVRFAEEIGTHFFHIISSSGAKPSRPQGEKIHKNADLLSLRKA